MEELEQYPVIYDLQFDPMMSLLNRPLGCYPLGGLVLLKRRWFVPKDGRKPARERLAK